MALTIRLRVIDKQNPVEKSKILELSYGKFKVPFTRIFNTNEGYKAICRNEQDSEKILSKDAREELHKIGIQVLTPPGIKSKRTIFIRQLDYNIGSKSAEEIKYELERVNEWLKIEEVIKIKEYTNLLKIRFEETSMVEKAIQKGLLAFNMAISSNQIEQEQYIHIETCYNCYEMEDHQTKDCPHTGLKVCSECSETGHTFKECTNTEKACLSCKKLGKPGNHRTLAMTCPQRKAIINNKLDQQKHSTAGSNEKTYADIAKRTVEEMKQNEIKTNIILSEEKHSKILISIMHAHVLNLCNPGSYKTELNKMLLKNDLPAMWFPDDPDSSKLLGATVAHPSQEKEHQTPSEMVKHQKPAEHRNRDPRLQARNTEETNNEINEENDMTQYLTPELETPKGPTYPEAARDIGLKIHLTGTNIMPTIDPPMEYILQHIQRGNFKWTYTDARYQEGMIRQMITKNKLKISKEDFKRVDEGSFRKIRNGLNDRSPPEGNRRTKKHS